MALRFVIGKPGGGKSMFAVEMIIHELRHGKRDIVTNVPLTIGKTLVDAKGGRCFLTALHEKYGETYKAHKRIRLLTTEETAEFWLHPGRGVDITTWKTIFTKVAKSGQKREEKVPDFDIREGDGGILYVIDEVHHYFNARRWADTGSDCLYYISMHRHFADDIYCVTQHPDNVEKQFRSVAQEYIELRNLSYEKLFFFRIANRIMRKDYLSWPCHKAMATTIRSIDTKFLGRCYRTEGGVGMSQDSPADMGKKNRRPSFIWMIVGIILAGFLCIKGFAWGGKYALTKALKPASDAAQKVQKDQGTNLHNVTHGVKTPFGTFDPKPPTSVEGLSLKSSTTPHPTNNAEATVWITGIVHWQNAFTIYLSDGRQIDTRSPHFNGVIPGEKGVRIDGKEYYFRSNG